MTTTVLVVDDSPLDRRAVGSLLEAVPDLDVRYANNVDQALEALEKSPPQVVLTDLIMPHRDGLELVSTLTRDFPLIPVILMTGRGSEEIAVKALQAGAASYVPKAAIHQLLLETIQHVLAVAREERSQMQLMGCMTHSECRFELDNDPALIPPLVNFLHRSIRTVGLCDESEGIRVCVALEEAVNNALFHGNLELSSELRENSSEEYRAMMNLRRSSDPYQGRRVVIEVSLTVDKGVFVVRDQGPGFNPQSLPDPTAAQQIERCSGRGLLLIRTFMDEIAFNPSGNELTLTKVRPGAPIPAPA